LGFYRLGWISKFKDSISFRIQDKAKYGQPLRKCPLKLAAVLQLNVEGSIPVGVRGLPLIDGGRDQDSVLYV
jgi:hypothetical protein